MLRLTEFVDQQRTALQKKDVELALQLLAELEEHLQKTRSWHDLRTNPPETYPQLVAKLKDIGEVREASGRTEMKQLIRVFEWCEAHDIALAELEVSSHLHKYVEAAAYLNDLIESATDAADMRQRILNTIGRLKADRHRSDTRRWARISRNR